ncbi:sterol desaturase family protein [Jiella endophytica]|uniref:Sterol desaturase family protein n=1 Tax=Jiella endophytica TaxID=2558362 RepID=A0A4Y8RG87_9HYPH|nr:sterol desaturase family protein [Jiella endophytica]TFF21739.1 sterol desaturase family protein [Jiella endophytica]
MLSPASFDTHLRVMILFVATGFIVLEYGLSRLAHHDGHDLKESAASFAVWIGHGALRALEAGLLAVPFALAYQYRLFDFDTFSPLGLGALFLLTEFAYYWYHRASHRIRWLWATHAVHHSSTRMNLTAAVRLGWTGTISGHFLFFLPLAFLGFHPIAIVGMLTINLAYQFFTHTELSPRLGPLEWVLNTPAHHRVHHASNTACLDRNYGGVLIVFDRLFGTFAEAPKDEPLRYGLVGVKPSLNPLKIAFGEWARMGRDLGNAGSWRERVRAVLAPPGPPIRPKTVAEKPRTAPTPFIIQGE